MKPLITICIPSYNRPNELVRLLNTIVHQIHNNEILIIEDNSPRRNEIKQNLNEFILNYPKCNINILYNKSNLGYDGNIRKLIEKATGKYCLFMGDDDILCDNAILRIENLLKDNTNIGVILRSWEDVNNQGKSISIQRYFSKDTFFQPGESSVVAFFRKSIFISGLVINRKDALKQSTSDLDGKLLYQLYLIGNILLNKPGFYIYELITKRISGGEHFFGSAKAEQEVFEPSKLTIEHSFNFIKGIIDVIKYIDRKRKTNISPKIITDLSKYSFGFLYVHRDKGVIKFLKYVKILMKLNLGKTFYFYFYVLFLLILGKKNSEKLISIIKKTRKNTPQL